MLILSICSSPEVLKVIRIFNTIISILRIVVPILLVLTSMITLVNAIKSDKMDLLVTAKKQLLNKCIAAVIIFLIPTLVNVIVKMADSDLEYSDCLYANTETINEAYSSRAERLVSSAEESKTYNDYYAAKNAVSKLDDEEKKSALNSRLDALYEIIKAEVAKKNESESSKETEEEPEDETDNNKINNISGTIYMGDSRTNGLKIYGDLSSDEQVFATDGGGYNAFLNHINSVNAVLSSGKSYNIVLNYGVNDMGNASKYCEKYQSFINSVNSKNNVYVMSVNPVRDSGSKYAKNANIGSFNSYIKSCISGLKNTKYCDVYGSTSISNWENNYVSSDAIHYTSNGYKYIHSKIKECMN